ncbi:rCG32876 [Rattus norvegicus]|uniref:RCG32876 n=1 Tax=Rattus norvegicus TaxID=10116 RepID=A6HJR6_RAT|nr:rCG32876 [Rattus norvegicus]
MHRLAQAVMTIKTTSETVW